MVAKDTATSAGITFHEIVCRGKKLTENTAIDNILEGKSFAAASEEAAGYVHGTTEKGSYGYDKLTDGVYNRDATGAVNVHAGRFATFTNNKDVFLDGIVELGGRYALNELRIYDFGNSTKTRTGDEIVIHARKNGEWFVAASFSGTDVISAKLVLDASTGLWYLPVDLSGVHTDAIRVYAKNSSSPVDGVTLYEITCSGESLASNVLASESGVTVGKLGFVTESKSDNILVGKTFVANEDMTELFAAKYGIDKLTDGIYNKDSNGDPNVHLGRYSSKSEANPCFDGTVTLGATYVLDELRIYDYVGASDKAWRSDNCLCAR